MLISKISDVIHLKHYKWLGAGEGNRTLATSLEGWGSTTELHPQNNISSLYKSPNQLDKHILVGMSGFEPLKAKLTDLQSVPFGQLWNIPKYIILKFITLLELMIGLEPTTYWLQINCSTNWATSAYWITLAIQMATWMGFEPTTSAVTGRHSNQLNYQAINIFLVIIGAIRSGYKQ